jgi:hypothetical protein
MAHRPLSVTVTLAFFLDGVGWVDLAFLTVITLLPASCCSKTETGTCTTIL